MQGCHPRCNAAASLKHGRAHGSADFRGVIRGVDEYEIGERYENERTNLHFDSLDLMDSLLNVRICRRTSGKTDR